MSWVRRFLDGVVPGGDVLDLACGGGRHARLALDHGLRVTALDRDVSGVRDLKERGDATVIEADLETGQPLPFVPKSFDGIIVTNYLWRPILPDIIAALRDDGVLIYATFARGHRHADGRAMRADFLLKPHELLDAVRLALQVVAFEQGAIEEPGRRGLVQRIAACGKAHRWAGAWPLSPAGAVV